MSSILDALERAEQKREVPGVAPRREPLARSRRLWQRPGAWLFGAGLLLLNLLVLWLMHEPEMTSPIFAAQTEPAKPVPRRVAPPAAPRETTLLAVAQASVSSPVPIKPVEPESVAPMVAATIPARIPVPPLLEMAAVRTAPGPESPRIPAIWELSETTQQKLKDLKINIHVYNEAPEERFVIIDMHRYREGEPLARPSLKLESITRDGVVIHYGEGRVRL